MRREDVVVYGKNGCPACDDAKRWFNDQNQEIEYLTLGIEYSRDFLLAKNPFIRSVPAIFIFGQYIAGGLAEVRNNWPQLSALSAEKCAELAKQYEELEIGTQ